MTPKTLENIQRKSRKRKGKIKRKKAVGEVREKEEKKASIEAI